MNNTDFIIEFDLLYNNALGTSAPNINRYEKSLFLTEAQESIIRDLYEDKPTDLGFEKSERSRRRLAPLVINSKVLYDSGFDTSLNTLKIGDNSKFFKISDDAWYITFEQIVLSAKNIKVIPVTQDEYSRLSDNPFKFPNTRKAWRLDLKNTESIENVVEIISPLTLTSYQYRYLTKPSPIVLVDLDNDAEFSGSGLSIDGVTDITNPVLPSEVHRIILQEPADLATLAYKENTLANSVQLNNNSL